MVAASVEVDVPAVETKAVVGEVDPAPEARVDATSPALSPKR